MCMPVRLCFWLHAQWQSHTPLTAWLSGGNAGMTTSASFGMHASAAACSASTMARPSSRWPSSPQVSDSVACRGNQVGQRRWTRSDADMRVAVPCCAGSLLVTAGGTDVCIWHMLQSGQLVQRVTAHQKTVTSVVVAALASPQPHIVSAGLDGHVKVCEPAAWLGGQWRGGATTI